MEKASGRTLAGPNTLTETSRTIAYQGLAVSEKKSTQWKQVIPCYIYQPPTCEN